MARHGRVAPRGRRRRRPDPRPHLVVLALCGAALSLWASALPGIDTEAIGDMGLVSVLPVSFFAALALLNVSFVVSVVTGLSQRWKALHVGALVVVVHGTLPLIYDSPRFAYVYKHLGVVELVSRYGSVDRTIDAYNNWPGFFLLNAFFREAAGLSDSLAYAPWAPVFFNLGFVLVLLFVYRSLVRDEAVRWLGVWVFLLGNWVGQDYLAPQAFGFLLHLSLVGVAVSWLPRSASPWRRRVASRVPLLPAPRGRRRRIRAAALSPPALLGGSPTAVGVLVVTFGAIVASHQLSPLLSILAVTALVLVDDRRPWWLPLLMTAMTAAWFWLVAGEFLATHGYLIGAVGQRPDAAVSAQLSDLTSAPGQVTVAVVARLLTAAVWALAAAGVVLRRRHGHRGHAVIALAVAPLPLISAVSYGGEMLFRIHLFSLPWVSLLAAHALAALCRSGAHRAWRAALAAAVCTALAVALSVAAYGQEKANHIRPGEVEASSWFYENAPDASLMMLVNGNFPARLEGNYGRFEVGNLLQEPRYRNYEFSSTDVARIVRVIEDATRAGLVARDVRSANAYVVLSTSQVEYAELYRLASARDLASLERVLAASPQFEIVYANDVARIYQLLKPVRR